MRKKIGLALVGALAVTGAVLAYNTVTFEPAGLADASDIRLAGPIEPDANAAAQRLGAAIRFQTISNQDPARNRMDEWS
ncbi:MAG: hypothetical protein K2W91_05830, partial [Novosphingobium sp.]|nr:hypothetical protein [Novosphingobium sp.]